MVGDNDRCRNVRVIILGKMNIELPDSRVTVDAKASRLPYKVVHVAAAGGAIAIMGEVAQRK